jgi:hypothetical protein
VPLQVKAIAGSFELAVLLRSNLVLLSMPPEMRYLMASLSRRLALP